MHTLTEWVLYYTTSFLYSLININSVVFLINSKVLLFQISHIMYSYYRWNILTLVIYRFITCVKEYSQKIFICLYFVLKNCSKIRSYHQFQSVKTVLEIKNVVHFNNCWYKFEILCFVSLYMNSDFNKMTYNKTIAIKHLEYFKRSKLETIF